MQYITRPRFHSFFPSSYKETTRQQTQLFSLHLVKKKKRSRERKTHFILNVMPAEPGALLKHENTNLICTFCQSGGGIPARTRGSRFPRTSPEVVAFVVALITATKE